MSKVQNTCSKPVADRRCFLVPTTKFRGFKDEQIKNGNRFKTASAGFHRAFVTAIRRLRFRLSFMGVNIFHHVNSQTLILIYATRVLVYDVDLATWVYCNTIWSAYRSFSCIRSPTVLYQISTYTFM